MPSKKLRLLVLALVVLGASGLALRLRHRPQTNLAPAAPPARLSARAATPLAVAALVYDGKLAPEWEDWGWGPHELSSNGPAKIVFGGYGGIVLHHTALPANFGFLSFRYKPPDGWSEFLVVSLKGSAPAGAQLPSVVVEQRHVALVDGWREVLIPFSELDPQSLAFDRIVLAARLPVGSEGVLLDKVVLGKPTAGGGATVVAHRSAQLSILCGAPTHRISPQIYGSAQGAWESGQTAQRMGGNPATRFNWELGVWNTGNDWFFENVKGLDVRQFLDSGVEHAAFTALTIPMIGWVAKDATSVGFPRALFANQRKYDPNRKDVGDGYRSDGSPIQPGPATQTSLAASPDVVAGWVRKIRDQDAARGNRSVQMYILDNEPSLWDTTHRDVHPEPLSYDELLDRTLRYAGAIRKADPEAQIAGPAEWGWLGYFYSGRDRVAGKLLRPDRRAHGDMPLIPWYLQQIAEHEKSGGDRILDVLDVHFYPAEEGLYGSNARTDTEGSALRIRATRSLWDPSYRDESWINEPIRLIPRLKEWVASYHPGLGISLGEWSFGGDEHISGALATAEALGRFGQLGVDRAFYWNGPKAGTATFWAFSAYRNFDGHGAHFQDVSLATRDAQGVSLFASRNDTGTKIVAVLLNLDADSEVAANIDLVDCGEPSSSRTFRFVSGASGLLAQETGKPSARQVSDVLPPYSVTVLDIDLKAASAKP